MLRSASFSRVEIIKWVNDVLTLDFKTLEEMKTGSAACQVLDYLHPGDINLAQVNWAAVTEYDFLKNFKLFSFVLAKRGIKKEFNYDKLAKGIGVYEFLKWLFEYAERVNPNREYDGKERREAAIRNFAGNHPLRAKDIARAREKELSRQHTPEDSPKVLRMRVQARYVPVNLCFCLVTIMLSLAKTREELSGLMSRRKSRAELEDKGILGRLDEIARELSIPSGRDGQAKAQNDANRVESSVISPQRNEEIETLRKGIESRLKSEYEGRIVHLEEMLKKKEQETVDSSQRCQALQDRIQNLINEVESLKRIAGDNMEEKLRLQRENTSLNEEIRMLKDFKK
mmetsp:Transcript_16874/g.42357  ORF Transcript_16874/g.42357 Transcript_16874/m.42357 type:complete len:342 (-) Transcript_16874:254-1279(-)